MLRSISEINEKLEKGQAVVATVEEVIEIVKKKGLEKAAKEIDVVTTGTFGPMCSSGVFLNLGHSRPRIKLGGGRVHLNNVPAYAGLAAVDIYIGATALPNEDPRNRDYPGSFHYGGGHVIADLVSGKEIRLQGVAYGTDCYPRKEIDTFITLEEINEAILFNPRNAYQNYNVAVNLSARPIYTYMGLLKPRLGNANYCSAGQLSPLLKDPHYRTIGIGTRIFLGGGIGYVAWWGTQHNPCVPRVDGVPTRPSGTLALIGDLKGMDSKFLRGVSILGYGTSLMVGIGIPIPILDEEIMRHVSLTDAEIFAPVVDYSKTYPERETEVLGEVSYAELRSGYINLQGKQVRTSSLSSYAMAREISQILKAWMLEKRFFLTDKVAPLPGEEAKIKFKPLEERR